MPLWQKRVPTPDMMAGDSTCSSSTWTLARASTPHLHDGVLPDRGEALDRRQGDRLRPANHPIRRHASRRADAWSLATSRSSDIPDSMRHGMTIGELARLFNDFGIGAFSGSLRCRAGHAEMCDAHGAVGGCRSTERTQRSIPPSSIRNRCSSKARRCLQEGTRLSRAPASELVGCRWVTDERRGADATQRAPAARRPTSVRRFRRATFHKTRTRLSCGAGARFTSAIGRSSSPCSQEP